ncbi:MAG: DNA polymerase III subunit beta [Mesorhizobium sp.]|uniref:Beta sliding clamp n=1 Tax=Mesorhizobium wenxiniae TaxID=2014805 RepID=A0A271KNG5_9HYPH|nr:MULTISPECIES: DNA polymerase III subunit beta [Mesorhizobium]RUV87433.1 DNA polymerase III subunit beta [Mesorhizobium sp. M5C.F.Ca.IN.020.14.1.1]PAP97333.1 DNA polymerase III subunit beta [Mesorhizobium wenxiniae]QIA20332.1 DNA polymerase III subunit beta [Mesorhizobium sp. AA22]RUV26278.1 DNA polymerase III subunit beta [Mesorhizobium sp. M5C.F.Ca.IN.020.32.2.1]RUV58357.1 DNA polymerase III subunit beta [Mesorhizobium sp. M5C.F.Ca.IN.020.29.1.1]
MRVILERSNLLKSLNHVHRVVERRNTIPILSNVLLSAEGATLEMKATDLDLEVTEATPAKVERGGATTVPAHLLYDIVRKLADGAEVMLKTDEDGNAMTVTSGRSSFRLQCLPQSDFPALSAGSFSHIFRLDSVALKGLIEKTQFAISTEETRYYLNGIYLHTHDADGKLKLRSVATDGHRLARAEIDAPAGSEGMPGIIIPRKTVSELQKLVDDPDVAVTTELSDTKIRFTIGSVVLTSKLIDGTFPDYQRVIPTGNDKKLIIDRQSFAAAVDRVSTISSERGRAVKLSIGEGQVTLAVNNPDSGSATEELAADYSSDAIEIGFNAKYLLDVAAQLTGTEAKFMLADAGSPTLIHDMADETTLYVLMPMRV